MTGVALNVSEAAVHIVRKLAVTLTDGVTVGITVITTLLLVSVGTDAQAELEVTTLHTVSLFARVEVAYVAIVLACKIPFLNHWYVGLVPPLVTVEVKVTDVLAQMLVCDAVTVSYGAVTWLTVICTCALATLAGDAHAALDVSTHQTESLFANVRLPYTGELVPTLTLFFFH